MRQRDQDTSEQIARIRPAVGSLGPNAATRRPHLLPLIFGFGGLAAPIALGAYAVREGLPSGLPLWIPIGVGLALLFPLLLGSAILRFAEGARARGEIRLAEQREVNRQLSECGGDLCFHLDLNTKSPAESELLSLSRPGMRLSGWSEDELSTLRGGDLFSAQALERIAHFMESSRAPGMHGPLELELNGREGEILHLDTWLRRLEDGTVEGFARNERQRLDTLREVSDSADSLNFLGRVERALGGRPDLPEAAGDVLDIVLDFMRTEDDGWAALYTLDKDGQTLNLVQARGTAAGELLAGRRSRPLGEGSLCGEAALSDEPRFSTDCRPGEQSLHGKLRCGEHSHCAVPLRCGETLMGVLLIGASVKQDWSKHRTQGLSAAGRRLAASLQDHRKTQAHWDEVEALSRDVDRVTELLGAPARFLKDVSHEISTPLRSIVATAQLSRQGMQDPEQGEHLAAVERSGESLLRVLDNFLDFARLESGDFVVEQGTLSARDCIKDALNTVAWQAQERGINLKAEVERAVPDALVGDRKRITQILINLLSNGIRATEQGNVVVKAELGGGDAGTAVLNFSVRDSGVGILDESQQQIFTDASADGDRARPLLGPDMNLSLAALLVKRLGGRIWVQSAMGRGNTINFNLKLAQGNAQAHLQDPAEKQAPMKAPAPPGEVLPQVAQGAMAPGLAILVAIADARSAEPLCAPLREQGHRVELAGSGIRVLEEIAQQEFHLVLLDADLPDMDGISTVKAIREFESSSGGRLPVIMLMRSKDKDQRQRCLEAGADGCAPKALGPVDLYRIIAENCHADSSVL